VLAAFEASSGRQAGPGDLPQLVEQARALEAAEGARPGITQPEVLEDLVGSGALQGLGVGVALGTGLGGLG
jgi:hypothetical protein